MTDIRKDYEDFIRSKGGDQALIDLCNPFAEECYQAGRAHGVDELIAELVKQSNAFRDSENSGMIDIQRVIKIIRKHLGKE